MIAMSMVAAYSEKMKFGTAVTQLPLRNPVVLAKEMATLDHFSNGRFLPAVGLGQEDPREYEACGVSKEDRGKRCDEAMAVMRRLWSEDFVTHHGEFFTLNEVSITPKPVQQPADAPLGRRSQQSSRPPCGALGRWLAGLSRHPTRNSAKAPTSYSPPPPNWAATVDDDHIGALLGFYIAPTCRGGSHRWRALHHPRPPRRPLHRIQRPRHPRPSGRHPAPLPGCRRIQVRSPPPMPT